MTNDLAALYRVGKNAVDIVDVPELGYVVIEGAGAPDGDRFQMPFRRCTP